MSRSRGYGSGPRDSSHIPEPYIFYQFYSASDDPWFPASVIQPAQTLTQPRSSTSAYNHGSRGFHDFRSPALPSECDTAPEDSGYGGSRPTYSIVESVASVNENDRCAEAGFLETQTAEQLIGIGDLNITSAAPMYKAPGMASHQATNAKLHRCEQCGVNLKTKSELKKHSHRHNKPWKCTYENCPKATQGFSTPNDLSRHKRTVHREHNSYGAVYVCREDPCIQKKEKLWPRADNFRSHLIRAHNIHLKADDDLRYYRHQPRTITKSHELRDPRSSVVGIRPGPRPTQTRQSSLFTCRNNACSREKENIWPTADDLRFHLARVHNIHLKAGDDIKHYHYQPEAEELHALRGVGSSVADVDPERRPTQVQDSPDLRSDQVSTAALGQLQSEPLKQSSLPLTTPCLQSEDDSQLMGSNILDDLELTPAPGPQTLTSDVVIETASVGEVSLEDSETALPGDEPAQEHFDQDEINLIGGEEEVLDSQDPLLSQAVPPDSPIAESKTDAPQSGISESRKIDDDPDDISGASIKALLNSLAANSPNTADAELLTFARRILLEKVVKESPSDVLSMLKSIPKELLEKALKCEDQTRSGNEVSGDQAERQCPTCPKRFSRKCELKKHMKRHVKPYGCTYKTCHKMFGSKNDWKRHESSQHFQMESWNCDLGCGKVLPRREQFKTHLQNDHGIQEGQVIENKLESCRLGRHCDPRFWCGFCEKFIEIKEKAVNSWTKRCDHIDNHLFGKEGAALKNIGDWCYLEDKLAKGDPESSEKPKAAEASSGSAKKRKAAEDVDTRPTKKHSFIWICCLCKHPESYRTSSRCMDSDCGHQRCDSCVSEQIPDLDHETEPVSQEEER